MGECQVLIYDIAMWQLLKDNKFLHATAVLIGTMVGVGIFGIPLSFTKSGFLVGLLLAVAVAFITVLFDLIYAEIVLRTEERHQLVGYAERYLGVGAKRVMFFAIVLGIYGALLAYIHFSGGFLGNIFSGLFSVQREFFSVVFFVIVAAILPFGYKTVSKVEFALTSFFIILILLILGLGIPHIDFVNYSSITVPYWYLPYGVLLFAFAGLSSIPIQRNLLNGDEKKLKPSIIFSVALVGILYMIFAFTVVGISGLSTSDDALSGLVEFLGPRIVWLGSLFGVAAITTSFLMLSQAMMDIFSLDYGLRRSFAWLLTVVPPFVLYMGGLRSAVDVISLVGAVSIGAEALVLLFIFRNAKQKGNRKPEFSIHVPDWAMIVLGAVFLVGIVFQLFIRY